jgi:Phytanoyl-CoA dioxygenase (PhyH)
MIPHDDTTARGEQDQDRDQTSIDIEGTLGADYWRALGGERSLARTLAPPSANHDFTRDEMRSLVASFTQEGYFITRPLLGPAIRARLLALIDRIAAHGLNPTWAMLFDDFWRTFARLGPVLETLLGREYRYVTGAYVFVVENTDTASGWGKHRDLPYATSIDDDRRPYIMSCWTALTDATPLNSCLYCLPYSRDPNFPDRLAELAVPRVEDIECMQVHAGQVIGLSHALLHWGSRGSSRGASRRVSFVFDTQRADVPCYHQALLDPRQPLSFEQRAAYVAHVILWLRRNNVRFGAHDIAIARQMVDSYGDTIGLTSRFFDVYVHDTPAPVTARYA